MLSLNALVNKNINKYTMDKILFTPGPLTTSKTIKEAMLRDLGSRDNEFIEKVAQIRDELLKLGGVSRNDGYEAILMQGSGTFGIEAVLSSVIPEDGQLLNIINGAYGKRISKITAIHHIKTTELVYEENCVPLIAEIEKKILSCKNLTHICMVHCETTTGIFNPVEELGYLANKYNLTYIVDAMSSFGAVPLNLKENYIDFLISSSNKCIEGVPGFSFILAKRKKLENIEGIARTLSLDLYAQWKGLETDGQFRFTPPVHALIAFRQALAELEMEGGVEGRAKRYNNNFTTLMEGMGKIGFKPYLPSHLMGYIITSFYYPEHANFNFSVFYNKLSERGFVTYPGKLGQADCFRIGNIGRLNNKDILALLSSIKLVLREMDVNIS